MALREKASFLRTIGSLWFAAVLLAILVVAMAAATVYEMHNGTDQAKYAFYNTWWMKGLFSLIVVNIICATVVRAPFTRHHLGFLITHLSLVLIFIGAITTTEWAVDGHLVIGEGQTLGKIQLSDCPTLSIIDPSGRKLIDRSLDPKVFAGFTERSNPLAAPIAAGDLRVEVRKYLPDAEESRDLLDNQPNGKLAVDVALLSDNHDFHTWVMAGETGIMGSLMISFKVTPSTQELEKWLSTSQPAESESIGTVKLEIEGQTYPIALEQCLEQSSPIGQTGYSIKVTRYLPHAVRGMDKTMVSASSQPVNPYIEAEITSPSGTRENRRAFARFPEFDSMHGATTARAVSLKFETTQGQFATEPIEILAGPTGDLFVRFSEEGRVIRSSPLAINTPVETPWDGVKFVIRERREKARWEKTLEPVTPARQQGRQQAIQVAVSGGDTPERLVWLPYGHSEQVMIGTKGYDLQFEDAMLPLGFQVKLERFRVIKYPGTEKPRSFESQVTLIDPKAGGETSRVISMNQPLTYGGFTFYQSSYSRDGERFSSVLGVSRDVGRPIAYAGYILLLLGMIWVLLKRMQDRKKPAAKPA